MEKVKRLTDYIVPEFLENQIDKKYTSLPMVTCDWVYLPSAATVVGDMDLFSFYPTDYAIINGACLASSDKKQLNERKTTVFLRDPYIDDSDYVFAVDCDSAIVNHTMIDDTHTSICPYLNLSCSAILDAQKAGSNQFEINLEQTADNKKVPIISFGEYPTTYVGKTLNKWLETVYTEGKLKPTGKKYTGSYRYSSRTYNNEYKFNGHKYVRVPNANLLFCESSYRDCIEEYEGVCWVRVEPIKWRILNWDKLPKYINPEGTDETNSIRCRTEKAIIAGIPFYPTLDDDFGNLWQNSTIRGYLNGINVNNIDMSNGNSDVKAPNGGDFTESNFLTEAMGMEISMVAQDTTEEIKDHITKKKSRIEKLNPDTTTVDNRREMTDTEMIKSWINNGESVLLRGPSGIGKTERIRREYGDRCIYLKLTNNMFPEKVVGSVNLQTGQEVPPNYAKEAILACATPEERKQVLDNIQNIYDIADDIYARSNESDEKIVILLDELLNVKPAVQSLVYTLVLNRFVENGKGLKLPKNVVVVATGNQKKYSSVAEDLAEPLEKRFDHILDMEPKVNEWLYEYAIPNSLHPSVINYISSKQIECRKEDISYFYEEPEVAEIKLDKNGCKGKTNDPRGWSSISQMLYNFERDLQSGKFIGKDVESYLKKSLQTKLRDEWAEEFFDFYNNPTISVEDVMNDTYEKEDLPKTINEKFATMAGLLSADMTEIEKVREFIGKHCSPEHREVYDLTWASGNVDRMQKIAELKSKDNRVVKDESSVAEEIEFPSMENNKITFWNFMFNGNAAIFCDEFWKVEMLEKAFKAGGLNRSCFDYVLKVPDAWLDFPEGVAFTNYGTWVPGDNLSACPLPIYHFDQVDFREYLPVEDIKHIEEELANQLPFDKV